MKAVESHFINKEINDMIEHLENAPLNKQSEYVAGVVEWTKEALNELRANIISHETELSSRRY